MRKKIALKFLASRTSLASLHEAGAKLAAEASGVGYEFGDGVAIEALQEIHPRQSQRGLQAADADRGASVSCGRHAFDEAFEILEIPDDASNSEFPGRDGQSQAAAPSAGGVDIARSLKTLGHLGQVIARDAVTARDFIDRHWPVVRRERHEDAQAEVGLRAEMHTLKWGISAVSATDDPAGSGGVLLLHNLDDGQLALVPLAIGPQNRLARPQADQACPDRSEDRHAPCGNIGIARIYQLDRAVRAARLVEKLDGRMHGDDIGCNPADRVDVCATDFIEQLLGDFRHARLCAQREGGQRVSFGVDHMYGRTARGLGRGHKESGPAGV